MVILSVHGKLSVLERCPYGEVRLYPHLAGSGSQSLRRISFIFHITGIIIIHLVELIRMRDCFPPKCNL